MSKRSAWSLIFLSMFVGSSCGSSTLVENEIGAYRFQDGRLVAVTAGEEDFARVREYETGWSARMTREGDAFLAKATQGARQATVRIAADGSALEWTEGGGTEQAARVPLREVEARFTSADGTPLVGKLILPQGPAVSPAVVLVHGSGSDAASQTYYNGYFLATHGIATLVYDKRGTGRSGGTFTAAFEKLSDDAAAAVKWTQSREEIDPLRVGLAGYSQGGWVAPLAATKAPAAFVIVNFGMIESPAYEENTQTMMRLRERGLDEQSLREAQELVEAATNVVASGFREWEEFDAVADKYEQRPWTERLDGTTAGAFLQYPHWVVRIRGPKYAQPELDWNYDGMETLRKLKIPVAWILGGRDISAPNELTIQKIRALKEEGRPHELILFEEADHNILRFEIKDGERVYLGPDPEYFRTEVAVTRRLAGLE